MKAAALFIRNTFRFLFKKPNIKVGEKLAYHGHTCKQVYFDWVYGLWFLKINDIFNISAELELYYRSKRPIK